MSPVEMTALLDALLHHESSVFDPPSDSDWAALGSKFNCEFDRDFQVFISLIAKYQFPGDILNVSSGNSNGNDTIAIAYDMEMENGGWNSNMIPFYGIGNGDYFAVDKTESPQSPVYYYYHDSGEFEQYCRSFEDWVRQLPAFLAKENGEEL